MPSAGSASAAPGQGGMVTATASSGESPVARNWKAAPTGIVTEIPAATATVASSSPSCRHISPLPPVKNHSSSTLRCRTARDVAPADRRKCAMLPRAEAASRRTCLLYTSDAADEEDSVDL